MGWQNKLNWNDNNYIKTLNLSSFKKRFEKNVVQSKSELKFITDAKKHRFKKVWFRLFFQS